MEGLGAGMDGSGLTPAEERALAALWQAGLETMAIYADAAGKPYMEIRSEAMWAAAEAWYLVLRDAAPVLDRLGVAGIVPPMRP
jgi:hypothetical protein